MRRIKVFLLLIGLFISPVLMAQKIAVKTNLLLDGLMAPNLGVELVTGNATSLSISMLSFKKCLGNDLKVMAIQPEYKFWYSSQPMNRGYIGIIGLAGFYKGDLGQDTYDGYGGGLGFSMGYVINVTNRLNLELSTGFGAFYYHQKKYIEEFEPVDLTPEKGYMLIPFQLGVIVSYVLK